MRTKINKTILFLSILTGLLASFIFIKTDTPKPLSNDLRSYSLEELGKFNGDDSNLPVYIGYEGYIYDVSAGRDEFYNPGKSYHYLAGKDSTTELNMAGGAIIKSKYKIVGKYSK